jgi:hypothetical protein
MLLKNRFKSGLGCVFGIVVAIIVVIVALKATGAFVEPCTTCLTTGKCILCRGSGEILWCTCPNCHGKKSCPECDGHGWRWKKRDD